MQTAMAVGSAHPESRPEQGGFYRSDHLPFMRAGIPAANMGGGRDFVGRSPHGDDLDLDACVEAMIDLRAGVQPNDRVHVSVRERRRDVAVAFAIEQCSTLCISGSFVISAGFRETG